MFDIGFWELAMLAVIALLVVGPERLPRLARTAGLWFGKIQSFVSSVKADIDRELKAEELKRIVEEQAKDTGLHEIVEETKSTLKDTRSSLDETQAAIDELERDFRRSQETPAEEADKPEALDAPAQEETSSPETSPAAPEPDSDTHTKQEESRRHHDE